MKKFFTFIILAACLCVSAKAQVFILNDNVLQGRMAEIKTTVLDSLTNEPVAFASVYVIPSKDTTITNFTLTDAKGQAKLDEVPYGSYVFHVEMMGYKPFVKERYFRNENVDMGTIRLQVDELFLQAATVTDVGNPIVMKKDTIEFNASSFRVGANAMLKDLLRRMPGMEITEDGKVKFNGEEIDQLTVGGRTFFFNDQATALNNLPASVVDKIRVIDRESEQTRASGIQDGQREKVLDVALKKEYEKGWFGNAGVKGGTTVGDKNPEELRDDRGPLYSGNVLVSAYNEKDQVTVIGNAQNVNGSDLVFVVMDEDGEMTSSLDQGLSTAAQLAVNVNTSRIKDVETTVSGNYKYTDTVTGAQTQRTTFQDGGDLTSVSENSGRKYANSETANLEMEKEKGKVWFHLRPEFRYNDALSFRNGSSRTSREGDFVNQSVTATQGWTTGRNAGVDTDVTFRDLWGKENRSLRLSFSASADKDTGESKESSELTTAGGVDSRNLRYETDAASRVLGTGIRYSEPLGEKWTLSTTADFNWASRTNVRDAFDAAGRNDYLSSENRINRINQYYGLTAQYQFGKGSFVTVGGQLMGVLLENYSKGYGVEETIGKDQWNWFVTPNLRFQYSKDNDRYSFSSSGSVRRPDGSRMLPVLNIGDPARLTVGNVYLKPYSNTRFSLDWARNNREKFSSAWIYLFGSIQGTPIIQAQWYDANGILYSIPVNSRKPGFSIDGYSSYTTPLDAKKKWSLNVVADLSFSINTSYQARTSLPGLDKDGFDYSDFMASFWGKADGDRFYSGASGFSESHTRIWNPYLLGTVKFNAERYYIEMGGMVNGELSRYSLDPSANLNTMISRLQVRGSYTTKHEFELESNFDYVFYNGYPEGYGQPEWIWNVDIAKSVGPFSLSVTLHDILNQTRNLTHTVTANYQEDSYRLVMGRFVLFGIKWNFGKMNAAHSQRAEQAAWDMVF